jgi:uncharacterized protein YkwD
MRKNQLGMMNSMVLTYLRLSATLLCVAILMFQYDGKVAAQETYVRFANHMATSPPAGTSFSPALEHEILLAVNAYRRSKGYRLLGAGGSLMVGAARAQAMDLLVQGKVGHVSGNGYNFESRMRAFRPGVMILPVMGENAARSTKAGLGDAAAATYILQQWIKSIAHRHTLTSRDYLTVATGVARRGNEIYAVQIFVGPEVKSNLNLLQ